MDQYQPTIATVESLTGGRLASIITGVPGSSSYYLGGYVCYSEEFKRSILGIDQETIDLGYDSKELAKALVLGAEKHIKTDVVISTTGYIDSKFTYCIKIYGSYHIHHHIFNEHELKMTRTTRQDLACKIILSTTESLGIYCIKPVMQSVKWKT